MRWASVVVVVALSGLGLGACRDGDAPPVAPDLLSATGLYADTAGGVLADGVRSYRPQYELWSDGAAKKRWLWLPPGTRIDTSDMDGWKLPVGTKAWKEFTVDGVRVETRFLQKLGPGAQEWKLVAYVWNREQTDAVAAPDGQPNALGTLHGVPDTKTCRTCHEGSADTLLGVSAIQLDHDLGGLDLAELAADDRLTVRPSGPYTIPGSDVERAALGYLHANCGHCHNERSVKPAISLRLALEVGALARVEDTPAYRTAIGATSEAPEPLDGTTATEIVVPGDPDASLLHIRMLRRTPQKGGMPPVGSGAVDAVGSDTVAAWIHSLAP